MLHEKDFSAILIVISLCLPVLFTCGASSKTLVLLGDSIAYGTGLADTSTESYGAITARANGWSYENYAVNGHTTYSLERRLRGNSVREGVARADVICISIGGNNFLQGGVVELLTSAVLQNDFTLADEIIAGVYESFSDSLAVIKELNPDAALIVQKLYNPRSDAFKEAYQQVMNRLNATFERI